MLAATRSLAPKLRALSVIAVVQLALWSNPSGLWASCGDWLAGHDDAHSQQLQGQQLQASNERETPPSESPCRGPGCRDVPAPMPTAPGRTLSFDQNERWCTLTAVLESPDQQCGNCGGESTPQPQAGLRLRVERPPRG